MGDLISNYRRHSAARPVPSPPEMRPVRPTAKRRVKLSCFPSGAPEFTGGKQLGFYALLIRSITYFILVRCSIISRLSICS